MDVTRIATIWLLALALAMALIDLPLMPQAAAQSTTATRPAKSPTYAKRTPPRQVAPAPVAANPHVVGRDAVLLVDAESGWELESHAADELRHPASLTKIMTLYMTFAALDTGRLRLSDRMPVSARAGAVQPSKMGVPVGRTLMVHDAVMGLITRSANDAAVVLAEAIAGDEDAFALQMTQTARLLGMSSTMFRNASGLPATDQVTTARDLARLAQAMMRDFPHYYPLFAARSWPYGGRVLANHNRMLLTYSGADGIKTGYIHASGFNLVMSAVRENRRLIGVVLGGSSVGERDDVMADMMDRGFERARGLSLPAWHRPVAPASARYSSASFTPGALPAEAQPQTAQAAAPTSRTVADLVGETGVRSSMITDPSAQSASRLPQGSRTVDLPVGWAIQLAQSFASRQAANAALRTALGQLPGEMRDEARPAVDAQKGPRGQITYRARLIHLNEIEAARGCRSLRAAKLFSCTTIAADPRAG